MMKIIMFSLSLNLLTIFLKKYFLNIMMNLMPMMIFMLLLSNKFNIYYWSKINFWFGMDNISLMLMMLSLWIMYLSTYSNNTFMMKKNNKNYINIMIILNNILTLCFCSMNMMIFYISFETSLIPILMIILGWGYQIDRIQASMYMMFYTLFGSLPLLLIIMYLFLNTKTMIFNILVMKNLYLNNLLIFFMVTTAFMIKMPMYFLHLWLPKAHVEAPISGSMILAGIMLKLGSYGLYRMLFILPNMFIKMNLFLIPLSMYGSLISCLMCLNQTDFKIIVAYSSVVHMSVLLASMLTLTKFSLTGSLIMMIAHGFCSPGMFLLVNYNYERTLSRNILINKGLINIFPSLSLWWFLIYSSNFSAPPSLNLFSEMMMFISLIQYNYLMIMLIMLIIFFSTCYSIFMYSFSQYGKLNYSFFNFKMINKLEYLLIFLLWMPLNIIFLNLSMF